MSGAFIMKLCLLIAALTIVATTTSGCGDGGPDRKVVTGTVTWKGQPIPAGVLTFDPDVSNGNKGPQGFTTIKDGKFDTRAERSKGCVSGPHIVTINGCDNKDVSQFRPYGSDLFSPHKMEIDIPADGGEINLVVPDSVQPAVPTSPQDL